MSDEPPSRPASPAWAREKQRVAVASIAAGGALALLKLAVGLATGSLGLLAEAAHSTLDLAASFLTWFAVRASWRPPDEDHQYGHAKAENLAALAETAFLALTSVWIFYEAGRRIRGAGPEVAPTVWAFCVMGLSIVVDFFRSRRLRQVARSSRSQALEADALNFRTDMASSAVVILGLAGVAVAARTGKSWLVLADPVAAMTVAAIVLVLSYRLGRRAVDVLMDRVPGDLRQRIADRLTGLDGVDGESRLRVRQAGDSTFVDVEVPLSRGVPVAGGSRVAERVRERVKQVVGPRSSILVQFRGVEEETLRDRVATAVATEGQRAHNITLRREPEGFHADLHLELPEDLSLEEAHAVADRVERKILAEVPGVTRADLFLDLHEAAPASTEPLAPAARQDMERRILDAARGVVPDGAIHDLHVARTRSGVYLSCHCFLPRGTPLVDSHRITRDLERRFREAVPELARVAVHAEPEGAD